MPLFDTTVPPLVSLLNSNSIPALSPLWTRTTDPSLPDDSVICLLQDDTPYDEQGIYEPTHGLESAPSDARINIKASLVPKRRPEIGSLAQPVIHIQSPTIRTTFIQAGVLLPSVSALGITLPFLGIQVRPLGERPFAVEVGVVDSSGNQGRIRMSTFQVCLDLSQQDTSLTTARIHVIQTTPTLHYSTTHPPVFHLPLRLPTSDATSLTPWISLTIHLPTLTRHFTSPSLHQSLPTASTPNHQRLPLPKSYASTSYIRLYASCRVKRVWMCARAGAVERGGEGVRDEWGMYARRL